MNYDISRLRKDKGMNQQELAQQLQITQSFLSAIENGKSPLPPEKELRLREIFTDEQLAPYILDPISKADNKRMTEMTDSDLFNQLLQRFHRQAHSHEDDNHHQDHHERIDILQQRCDCLFERNERLMERNDRLAEVNDRLREENDKLRMEIDALRCTVFKLKNK